MADYNELSEVSEEYLDSFFRSVFKDLQVRHDGTILFVSVNEDDPFTVDFVLTLAFIIPGEVPTVNYLIDGLQDGLESDTSMAFFVSDFRNIGRFGRWIARGVLWSCFRAVQTGTNCFFRCFLLNWC